MTDELYRASNENSVILSEEKIVRVRTILRSRGTPRLPVPGKKSERSFMYDCHRAKVAHPSPW
jgi:hypothetical protein